MPEFAVDDGTVDWSGGSDSWHAPSKIQPNQYVAGVNVSAERGLLSPRRAYTQLELTFDPGTVLTTVYGVDRSAADIWASGKAQALIPYPQASEDYVLTVISGLIFQTNLRTLHTMVLSIALRVNQYASRINWTAADNAVVIYDYPAYPIVIQNSKIFRADPNHEIDGLAAPQVPISVGGTYNQNRLFVYNAGVEFTAGDPVGSLATPEAPITFTEVFVPSAPFYRQVFSLPATTARYPITAMGFLQQVDTSTGIGQLYVGTRKKVYTYQTAQPRTAWGNGSFGTVLLDNVGIAGARAVVNVNSDFIFLDGYGKLHALSTSRNDQQRWGDVPISREVSNYLKFSDPSLIEFAALGYWNSRIFISANPYRTLALDTNQRPVTDYAHGGFVVLELEDLSSLITPGTPIWPGLWTGVDPVDICNVSSKCVVLGKVGTGKYSGNALYFIEDSKTVDTIKGRQRNVVSVIYTKEYDHGLKFDIKKEHTTTFHMQSIAGKYKLKIERRPTHSNRWLFYTEWEHEAPVRSCDIPMDELINGIDPQEFLQLMFGDAKEEGCNPVTGDSYISYHGIQYRFTISGEGWTLNEFKCRAYKEPFVETQDELLCSNDLPIIKLPTQCEPDWLIPEVDLCETEI